VRVKLKITKDGATSADKRFIKQFKVLFYANPKQEEPYIPNQ